MLFPMAIIEITMATGYSLALFFPTPLGFLVVSLRSDGKFSSEKYS